MANMTYCRFENTERDLLDCYRAMFESTYEMSEQERTARLNMFSLVLAMADDINNMTPDEMANGDPDAEYGEHDMGGLA